MPGITASSPLDPYYMPYTHSLIGALFWSLAATLRAFRGFNGWSAAAIIGAAVFSH